MQSIKLFGLAVILAFSAIVCAGVSPAMAESTSLCFEDSAGACPEGELVEHIHQTTLSGQKAKLLSSVINVECEVLFLGSITTELSAPLSIEGNLSYSNCSSGCTITEENGPAEFFYLKEGHETASVTYEALTTVVCSGFINCRYIGEGLKGTYTGPLLSSEKKGAVVVQEAALAKEGGILCPKGPKLDIKLVPLVEGEGEKEEECYVHINS